MTMTAKQEKESPLGEIETMIIMSLDADNVASNNRNGLDDGSGGIYVIKDQGILLPFDKMVPKSAYTFEMSQDEDRLFSTHPDYLLKHQSDTLGDESEVVMMSGGVLKWRGFRRLRKAPKRVCTVGRASHWYEMHQRFTTINGVTQYYKRVIPISSSGKVLPSFIDGHIVCSPVCEGEMLNLCCSLIEDAQRTGIMLASVKDATEIKFPVPIADYKSVFIGRDGPVLESGRKRAIIHWVASHLRKKSDDNFVVVNKHIRGVQSFVIDGISVVISPSKYDLQA